MEDNKNKIKIGITVIIAVIIGVVGFRIMRDLPLLADSKTVVSVFRKVDGLNEGKKIFINGVSIGSIKEVELTEGDSVRVIMTIDRDTDIPKDSKAFIRSIDFLGTKAVVIEKGTSSKMIGMDGRIIGAYDEGAFSEIQKKGLSLGDKVAEVSDELTMTLRDVRLLLQDELKDDLVQSMENLNSLTKRTDNVIAENEEEVEASIKSLQKLLASSDSLAKDVRPEAKALLVKLQRNSEDLEKLSATLQQTGEQLNTMLTRINNGKGSMGKLINDPSLYQNLDSLAYNLQRLVRNIDKNPNRYLDHVDITLF